MKYALPLALLAGPAFAHEGAHMHPHSFEGLIAAGALIAAFAATLMINKARK